MGNQGRIELADGRVLGFAEYGDPAGKPVVACHGGLSCSLEWESAGAQAARAGVRLIAADRPGIRESARQPGRVLLDWGGDVVQLADALGLDTFGVTGWSLGGPHALACAMAAPGRVSWVGLIASAVPFELAGSHAGLTRLDQLLLSLCPRRPALAALVLELAIRRLPAGVLWSGMKRDLPQADIDALAAAGPPAQALAFIRDSLSAGSGGVIDDYVVFGAPWGFDLGEISQHVDIWQGDSDSFVPPSYPALLNRHLRDSTAVEVTGEGHISLPRRQLGAILERVI